MISLLVLVCYGLLLCQPALAPAGWPAQGKVYAADNPFFASEEIVELTLSLPLDQVMRDRGARPGLHPALLSYRAGNGSMQTLAVQVQVRGNRRKDPTVCGFPPLLVKFPPPNGQSTLFGPVAELKLTTHCLSDNYTLREYLVYKLYNVLTDLSYRVRLCRITYRDNNGRASTSVHYGFFLENTEALARRNQTTVIPKPLFITMDNLDRPATATMVMFQFMIGNTDWSVPYRHNIRLLTRSRNTPPIPVAFDFDYSGLVMAPYAVPPEQLGITSVRQRLFRGFGFPPETHAAIRDLFNTRRAALYNVYLACPYLGRDEQDFATHFLDGFYKTLNDPKDFERRIVRVGRQNEKKYTQVRGFD
ncbi:hypothetical protein ACFP2F_18485 [Hymenobacter artigasi]|uniref:Uncharacterized protein n=1 Tax=Hymenobacter artigasi TaxID=2719616 RepID=A0ABX1HJT3_9BACT|nr:hypothetical protein [Hymenobacter artigasi]NKI90375.1 hypothetical protein [Hymenobacter artigasi]